MVFSRITHRCIVYSCHCTILPGHLRDRLDSSRHPLKACRRHVSLRVTCQSPALNPPNNPASKEEKNTGICRIFNSPFDPTLKHSASQAVPLLATIAVFGPGRDDHNTPSLRGASAWPSRDGRNPATNFLHRRMYRF